MSTDGFDDGFASPAEGELDFSMDGGGTSREDLGGDSPDFVDLPGVYHMEIVDVKRRLALRDKNNKAQKPYLRFDMRVLKAVKGQSPRDCMIYHRLYLKNEDGVTSEPYMFASAMQFGLSIGLLREATIDDKPAIVDVVSGSKDVDLDTWNVAKGFQCIVKVSNEDFEGNTRARMNFFSRGVKRPCDPRVNPAVVDQEAWRHAKNYMAATDVSGKAATEPAMQAPVDKLASL